MANPVANLSAYELRHLVNHLEAAGRVADLHHLLALETDEKRNAWYDAKESCGDTESYITDVTRVWELADHAYSPAKQALLDLQTRCALMLASLNMVAQNLPPDLVPLLVAKGVWTLQQAVVYARNTPDTYQRV